MTNVVPLDSHIRRVAFDAPIALWLIDLTVPPNPEVAAFLSCAEQERAARFVHDAHRMRYVAAHAALRLLVERHHGLAVEAQRYTRRPRGGWDLTDVPACRLSLSYAHDRALIGLADRDDIGVDIERDRLLHGVNDLARAYLCRAERIAYARLDPARRNSAFLQAWTRKEACAKAVGLGLHLPFADLDAGVDDGSRTIGWGRHRIAVASFHPAPGFVAAWAVIR